MARVGGKMCLEIQLGLFRVELRSISAPDWESWHGAAPETVAILKDETKADVRRAQEMPGLTCNACNKEFLDDADQKLHYKSDWHRYNLKRKVAGVPGVTEALFLARQSALAQEKEKQNETPMLYSCGVCGKGYRSSKAYSQHLKSRAHIMQASQGTNHPQEVKAIIKPLPRRTVSKPPQPRDRNDDESQDEWEEVDPEEELDPEGLLTYLGLKVKRDFMCLYCNERCHPFASLEAVRKHMAAKGHCKVHYGDGDEEEEAELEEFYDYSSSYVDESGKQLVAAGDTGNSVELVGGSELVITKRSDDGILSKTLGSREYMRYYRQKPRPSPANNRAITAALSSRSFTLAKNRNCNCNPTEVQEYGHSNRAVKRANSQNESDESNE
ncbi:hypothetical protein GOBAR_AA21744 [Gossypium barbadense]|uniref:C2H2-type domain-containing protein n=1 Tax=Gossypium barbadense TaxID=3634 RepID=A0A2P5X6G0_GOSBA|nr:hypothetical protein GOBAR_AA21744 [Gossypium barbadense]